MQKLIYGFSTSDSPQLSEVGGKGKALIEMTKAGFPVPDGIVLSVDFFAPWVSDVKKTTEWSALLTEVTKEKCDALQRKTFNFQYTEIQQLELEKHLDELTDVGVFAVRSSSPEEDLVGESFAGLYQTYLGVTRKDLQSSINELALDIGERLFKENRLERAEQIFDLHLDEITLAQKDENINLLSSIAANLEPYKKVKHVKKWPLNIDSRGKIFYPVYKRNGGELIGQAISAGVVRGKAKILLSPYEKPLNPGEILITHATEPAWTPIFINASGVVLEVGGLLQHGAIIAREYGIPCVSGLREMTSIVKDGDLLEVDGTNGIVKIIEK